MGCPGGLRPNVRASRSCSAGGMAAVGPNAATANRRAVARRWRTENEIRRDGMVCWRSFGRTWYFDLDLRLHGERASAFLDERLTLLRESFEQGAEFPLVALISPLKLTDALDNMVEPNAIGVIHRSAALGREPVAGGVDHVDVRGALRHAFLQNSRTFIDQRENQPFDNVHIGEMMLRDGELPAVRRQDAVRREFGDPNAPAGHRTSCSRADFQD